jgi:hypothetical protein
VQDVSDPSTPTGYVNYSLPWEALYGALLEVLEEAPKEFQKAPCICSRRFSNDFEPLPVALAAQHRSRSSSATTPGSGRPPTC